MLMRRHIRLVTDVALFYCGNIMCSGVSALTAISWQFAKWFNCNLQVVVKEELAGMSLPANWSVYLPFILAQGRL